MNDTYGKAANNEYRPKLNYPDRVPKPALLSKRVEDCSAEEIAAIPKVKETYGLDLQQYKAKLAAYQEEERRLDKQFRADLEEEFGMIGHPKADRLYNTAYEQGHANGYCEVASYYGQFVELVKD